MSWEATTHVLGLTVGDATRKMVLMGLANHAHKDGTAAWAKPKTLGDYAECSERTAQRHIAALLADGFIREGDQRHVAHIDGKYRPIVYDIAMTEDDRRAWAEAYTKGGSRRQAAAERGRAGGRKAAENRANAKQVDGDASGARGDNLAPLSGADTAETGPEPPEPGAAAPAPADPDFIPTGDAGVTPTGDTGDTPAGDTGDTSRGDSAATGHAGPGVSPVTPYEPPTHQENPPTEPPSSDSLRSSAASTKTPEEAGDEVARWWWERLDPKPVRGGGKSSGFVGFRNLLVGAIKAGFTQHEVAKALQGIRANSGDVWPSTQQLDRACRQVRAGQPVGRAGGGGQQTRHVDTQATDGHREERRARFDSRGATGETGVVA